MTLTQEHLEGFQGRKKPEAAGATGQVNLQCLEFITE